MTEKAAKRHFLLDRSRALELAGVTAFPVDVRIGKVVVGVELEAELVHALDRAVFAGKSSTR